MKNALFIYITFLISFFNLVAQDIPQRPSPPRLVNDFANVLSPEEEAALEQKLVNYNDTTSTQIAVVTVESLSGYDVNDFAFRIGHEWGVGQKDKNNGLVILVSVEDRKAAISTGYGLEGSITDADTREIRETHMNPHFREGNFYQGLDEATTAIIQMAAGEYTGSGRQSTPSIGNIIITLLVLAFLIGFPILGAVGRTRRNHIGSKNVGFWTALWLMSQMGGGRNRGGGWGGGGGFGGGGGGGFGGFGGGGFGGGGSGGSW